jgi:hypothetical protein
MEVSSMLMVVRQRDLLLWATAFVLSAYMVSALRAKIWYIAAAITIVALVPLVLSGRLRIDRFLSNLVPLGVYFGYLALTALWADYPSRTILGVAIDSIELVVFALLYMTTLNNPISSLCRLFVTLGYIAFPVTLVQFALMPNASRVGGYALGIAIYLIPFYVIQIASGQWRKGLAPLMIGLGILAVSGSRAPLVAGLAEIPLTLLVLKRRSAHLARIVAITTVCTLLLGTILVCYPPTRSLVLYTYVRFAGVDADTGDISIRAEGPDLTRAALTVYGIELLQEHWLWGIGYANFSYWFQERYGFPMNAHNSFISWPLEGGLPCTCIVIYMLAVFLRNLYRRIRASESTEERDFCRGCIVAMAGVLFVGLFHRAHQSPPLFLFLGIAVALAQKPRKPLRVVWRK